MPPPYSFHAWQGSLAFTVMTILHLIFHRLWFLSWVVFLCHLALMGWLAFNAYRDADTLDRYVLWWDCSLSVIICGCLLKY